MSNYYYFYNSVRVISGEGAVNEVSNEIKSLGGKNAFLISDKVLQGLGVVDNIKKLLVSGGVKVNAVYININNRPTLDNISEMYEFYRANGCDCLVACGGGNVINSAKGLKLLLSTQNKNILEVRGSDVAKHNAFVPFGIINTNIGTGVDVNRSVSIMDMSTKSMMDFESFVSQPSFTILSPELTTTLPQHSVACGLIDIVTHCIEAFCSINDNPLSQSFALDALTLVFDNYKTALKDPTNLKAMHNLQKAQLMASLAFSNSKSGIMYAIARAIGIKYDIAYSKVLSCVILECLRFNLNINESKYAKLLFYVAGADIYTATPINERADVFMDTIQDFIAYLSQFDIPVYLEQLGINQDQLDEIASYAYCDSSIVTNAKSVMTGDIQKILFNSLSKNNIIINKNLNSSDNAQPLDDEQSQKSPTDYINKPSNDNPTSKKEEKKQ